MTILNPSTRPCWQLCTSCMKCANKGQHAKCASCSGKHDPKRVHYPDPDDYCDCKNGILRHRTREGRLIVRKFHSNPFGGKVMTDAVSQDEQDWNSYLYEQRELKNDPSWNPVKIEGI